MKLYEQSLVGASDSVGTDSGFNNDMSRNAHGSTPVFSFAKMDSVKSSDRVRD